MRPIADRWHLLDGLYALDLWAPLLLFGAGPRVRLLQLGQFFPLACLPLQPLAPVPAARRLGVGVDALSDRLAVRVLAHDVAADAGQGESPIVRAAAVRHIVGRVGGHLLLQ